ncbi:phospho-sugar mutase [Alicyclobacillus fastidiosus]|uniref:Phosphoglucomutase n=1 Tax=Alicyclobacillus fastidiosus TaxID=392011 RepID=A0ABY6ZI97_9BACL|nr:phospho-sugar mutase [Alicyclobacillus fastidiosus]WAH42628.1 phospho-sugar mutase [Alicyclobacillus fastidiosus]GMA64499.1 phosphoglucomutase [Alicyclobacillus fastidiosus]
MTDQIDAMSRYEQWLKQPHLASDIQSELEEIRGNSSEIGARFGSDLDFGTGGLRGVMGAGLNRMNIYTVRRATRGLAEHLLAKGDHAASRGVAIGYDCRHNSALFASVAGRTLAAAGIKAYVSPVLCPTPELSFAVRTLGAMAGIMITASHNPPEYNGYKAYNEHGGQVLEDDAADIRSRMLAIDDIFGVPIMDEDEATAAGLLITTPIDVRHAFLKQVVHLVRDISVGDEARHQLGVVYTPLHGTGLVPVRETFQAAGYTDVHVLDAQAEPNGDFPTVKSPNPEEPEALEMAIQAALARGADLVMGTDPDGDRVGIAVRTRSDQMQLLTGNQVGALLVDYMCTKFAEQRHVSAPIVFKTIVTSEFGAEIARSAGIAVEETLTGFKYIGDRITAYERTGAHELLVGYEESYGYLIAPIVRDKDAVQTCLAIAEMAAFHRQNGLTLVERLEALYKTYGYFREELVSVALDGEDGVERMHKALADLRQAPLAVPGMELNFVEDYLTGVRHYVGSEQSDEPLTLPKSDVQKFVFKTGEWAAIRPSGTEPKMKVYAAVRGESHDDAKRRLAELVAAVDQRIRV